MPDTPRLCALCGKRKPKRHCPGIGGEICSICCGTEREVTIQCPLSCPYLLESRTHQQEPVIDPRTLPNMDIEVGEEFLRKNESLMTLLALSMMQAGLFGGDTILDTDIREALDALTRTYRTLESGLLYEPRPRNPLAGRVYSAVQETVEKIREYLAKNGERLHDRDLLRMLVFFQRLELRNNNGRPKSRAFLHFLGGFVPPPTEPSHEQPDLASPSELIITP